MKMKSHPFEIHFSRNRRCVRDVDEAADGCVLLVDTQAKGWKVMYAGGMWGEWTGR